MTFKNYKKDEPKGLPYLHMNFDSQFAWDTKDYANDKDNGFICKMKLWKLAVYTQAYYLASCMGMFETFYLIEMQNISKGP